MSTQLTRILSPGFALAIAAGLALTACNKGEEPKSAAVGGGERSDAERRYRVGDAPRSNAIPSSKCSRSIRKPASSP